MIQVNEYRTTKTGKIGSFPKRRKEPRELHKKKIVNLIYYVHDSFRSAIPSFHSRTNTTKLLVCVLYTAQSSTQESSLGQCSSLQRERKEVEDDRQERSDSKYWTIRRCYVLSPLLLLLPLRSALSASSLWNKIYLLLLSLGFVTGAKKKSLKNVCCLVVEKAAEHRREAEKAK